MINYIKIQTGFSSYKLLDYLHPGSYIYLESIENSKENDIDYPVVWIAGFGDSSKSELKEDERLKYKVKIDFTGTYFNLKYDQFLLLLIIIAYIKPIIVFN